MAADETPGRVAATLSEIRRRWRNCANDDVPRLLKAVEDALKHHVPAVIEDGAPPVYPFRYCKTCSGHPAWPCPEVADIGAALTGTQPSEDESDRG